MHFFFPGGGLWTHVPVLAGMEDDNYLPLATANREHLARHPGVCVACLQDIAANSVKDWINDATGQTAMCPHCGIDAVVPVHLIQDEGKSWRRMQILRHWRTIGFGSAYA